MRAGTHKLSGLPWIGTAFGSLALGSVAWAAGFAQNERMNTAVFAAMGAVLLFALVIGLAAYIYTSLALQTIARKTNTENGWMAWIPIINIILMLNIAKKPLWWFILFLVPLVNIVMMVIAWMGIAEARGKPNWWGILIIVPIANLIVPGYLAWAD